MEKDLNKDTKRKNIAKGEKLTTALTSDHKSKLKELAYLQNKGIADVLGDAMDYYFNKPKTKVFEDIITWAKERGIFESSNSFIQYTKLGEEVGEVAKALFSGDRENLALEIGDAGVVLNILAGMNGLSFEQCMVKAYKNINSRKTTMVNGTAVKESDL